MGSIIVVGNVFAQQQKQEQEQEQDNKTKQISITNNIKNTTDFGWSSEGAHEEFYSVLKMFDNKTGSDENGWSRAKHSGFTVILDQPLKDPVCSVAIDFYKPIPTTKYTLTMGGMSTSGNTDATTKTISLGDTCARNVDSFSMDFAANDQSWTTINEMRLYSKIMIPPIDPPVCGPNEVYDPIQKKCIPTTPGPGGGGNGTITNSTFTFNIANSKIILNALNSTITNPGNGNTTNPPPPGCNPDSYWNGTHCVPIGPPPPPPPPGNLSETDVTALLQNTSSGFVVKGFGDLFKLPDSFFELNETETTETETTTTNDEAVSEEVENVAAKIQLREPQPTIPDAQPTDFYKPGNNNNDDDNDNEDEGDEEPNNNNNEEEGEEE